MAGALLAAVSLALLQAQGNGNLASAPPARGGLGVNVAATMYWSGERSFANLLSGSGWLDPAQSWGELPAGQVGLDGVVGLRAGQTANRILSVPAGALSGSGVVIRCTWAGSGEVAVGGTKREDVRGDRSWEFFWPAGRLQEQRVWVELRRSEPSDPIRDLDCREKDAPRGDLFAAEYLQSLKPFSVLRFLDWSTANINPVAVSWSTRSPANVMGRGGSDGAAIENMVALANQASADPWFTIPWNADEDYVRRMAQLVHDSVPAGRRVYVELSNEVWNYQFKVAKQAETEGLAAGLSSNGFEAALRRYAEKTVWVMKIWSQVFADRPGQLVRVAATQHSNSWTAETVLGWKDTASNIDALATAPYFGHEFFSQTSSTDLAVLMPLLAKQAGEAVEVQGVANQAIAKRYGKRYIAYEAGQHLINPNGVELLARINRAPQMYDIYKSYIGAWKSQVNDVMVLYASSGDISKWGAWGLREYSGQPLAETPKRRAALEAGRP